MMPTAFHPPKIGVALGSGGARGWAHIGVLRRLNALGIRPDCIAGTSIGSIVGAIYAAGRLDTTEELASQLDWKRLAQLFLEVGFPRSGLLTGKHFMRLVKNLVPAHDIGELSLPFAAVATDLLTEKEVAFLSGSLTDAIRASIAIPGIFTPAHLNGQHLVDGGLVNPLPVSVCRKMGADVVIAVDINLRAPPAKRKPAKTKPAAPSPGVARLAASLGKIMPNLEAPAKHVAQRWLAPQKSATDALSIFDVLTRSFRVAENQITRRELQVNPPDILIQPEVGDIMTLEFHRGPEAIAAGVRAVDEVLPQLHDLLSPHS